MGLGLGLGLGLELGLGLGLGLGHAPFATPKTGSSAAPSEPAAAWPKLYVLMKNA